MATPKDIQLELAVYEKERGSMGDLGSLHPAPSAFEVLALMAQGCRCLPQFFTTTDFLRLSETCKAMLPIRSRMPHLKIRVPDRVMVTTPYTTMPAPLFRVLNSLRPPALTHLSIGHHHLVMLLGDIVAMGRCKLLVTLDLSDVKLTEEGADHVGKLLESHEGHLRSLQHLKLASTPAPLACRIVRALSSEGCPDLSMLDLRNIRHAGGIQDAIVKALQSGCCARITELRLAGTTLGHGGFIRISELLALTDLRVLDIPDCFLGAADGASLGEALGPEYRCCPKLEELLLGRNDEMKDEGVMPVIEALEASCCPDLKRLDLSACQMTQAGGQALCRAMKAGGCRKLQYLSLSNAFIGGRGSEEVFKAIRDGSCPSLLHLDLSSTVVHEDSALGLADALLAGQCERLEVLDMSNNRTLGDEAMASIMSALGHGACPNLRRLILWRAIAGPVGALALEGALGSGSLSRLQSLHLSDMSSLGDKVVAGVISAAASGTCPGLRSLEMNSMGGVYSICRTLCKALRMRAWPMLTRLIIRSDVLDSYALSLLAAGLHSGGGQALRFLGLSTSSSQGVQRLAEAFHGGACPFLEYLLLVVEYGAVDRDSLQMLQATLPPNVCFQVKTT